MMAGMRFDEPAGIRQPFLQAALLIVFPQSMLNRMGIMALQRIGFLWESGGPYMNLFSPIEQT